MHHRLELFIRGLRAPATGTLEGAALSVDDLKQLVAEVRQG